MGYYLKSNSTTHVRVVGKRTFFAVKALLHGNDEVIYNNIAHKVKILYLPVNIFRCVNNFLDKIFLFEDL